MPNNTQTPFHADQPVITPNGAAASNAASTPKGATSTPSTDAKTLDAKSLEAKASDVKAVVKNAAERVEDVTRSAASNTKEALVHVKEEGSALLHDASEAAVDAYHSARDHAVEYAHEASDLARRAGYRTASYARRASNATGRFVSVHALPLTLVGAGLGWLAWSIRKDTRRVVAERDYEYGLQRDGLERDGLELDSTYSPQSRLQATLDARRPMTREYGYSRTVDSERTQRSAPTASGAKLMGVRTRDTGYDR